MSEPVLPGFRRRSGSPNNAIGSCARLRVSISLCSLMTTSCHSPTYLAEIEQLFLTHPDVVLATGHVIADGIVGPGLRVDEAQQYLEADRRTDRSRRDLLPVYNGYGCNMAVRMSAVRRGGCLFDESLPLYGWLEDVDFSRRLGELGRVVLSAASRGFI